MTAQGSRRPRSRRMTAPTVMALLLAAAVAAPGSAAAYVQYRTSKGIPYSWCDPNVAMTAYVARPIDNVSSEDMVSAAAAALATWSAPAVQSCGTALQLHLTDSRGTAPHAMLDHRNSIIFRIDSWDYEGPPVDGGIDPNVSYDPSALALTTLFVVADGRILDTDIEINALPGHFLWTWNATPGVGEQDLQNTLTHEVGHVVGLDHTCWKGGLEARPTDDQGNPVPLCVDLPSGFLKTTMYPDAQPQDVTKRVLGDDEQRAVCAIYPQGTTASCPDEACACTVRASRITAGGAVTEELVLVAGLLGLLMVVRRRRRGGA